MSDESLTDEQVRLRLASVRDQLAAAAEDAPPLGEDEEFLVALSRFHARHLKQIAGWRAVALLGCDEEAVGGELHEVAVAVVKAVSESAVRVAEGKPLRRKAE